MIDRRGGEAKLLLTAEVEFPDEMETCISAGGCCSGVMVVIGNW